MIRVLFPLTSAAVLLWTLVSVAQTANIKDIPLDNEQSTTITIQKGTRPGQTTQPVANEVLEGSAEIEGESAPLVKVARGSWKKACDDWKKEVRELNKDNQILSINCGVSKCAPEATALTICRSTATYKIRLKLQ